ncbi:hypothetical protein DLK05_01260 [Ancylomarina longa]|uniref:Uncharacterized protein n=1 Tax=Ancylomarina longa TaxID=2487017 RepID=A0A434AZF6_9BACT|nr:hypothetical protein DLK05_01260 [Ancylomarina longa]
MKPVNIQSRTANIIKWSKNLYFHYPIFQYLFRCKHDMSRNFYFSDLDISPRKKYFYKKPTLLLITAIVGFFLHKINNHFIYTFNF